MSKKKIILGIILTLLLAVSILIVYSVSSLDELVIKGNTYYSEKSLKKMLIDKKIYNNTFALYIKLKYGPKLSIPFIDETDVDLKGPHSLVVRVYEKDIIGCIPYMGEYVCFDKDGIMVGSITEKRKDVPVVTGIEYNKIVYNKEVDTENGGIFIVILNLTQLIKKHEINVDRIDLKKDGSVDLYSGGIRVLLGDRIHFDEQLSNLTAILDKLKGMKGMLHMERYSLTDRRVVFEKEE